jgi:hypothetical protein
MSRNGGKSALSAEVDEAAQALYESEGWIRSTDFYVYDLPVKG